MKDQKPSSKTKRAKPNLLSPFVCKVSVLSYIPKAKDAADAYKQTCRRIHVTGCIKSLYRNKLAIAV